MPAQFFELYAFKLLNLRCMKKPEKVFIIDDDNDDVELFIEAVNSVDPSIQCYNAFNSDDALKKLMYTMEILPDIIFLDLNMPGINGKQCLTEIKKSEKLKDIPVVIYTTSSFHKDIEETKKLGASHFLTKPSSFSDTCKILSEIIFKEVN